MVHSIRRFVAQLLRRRLSIINTMKGMHLTADLQGCQPPTSVMTDVAAVRALCLQAVQACGLSPVGELFHTFPPPGGVTGVVLLAESHLAVHTWPEISGVTLDAYVCNLGRDNTDRARSLMAKLVQAFAPEHMTQNELQRGVLCP